MKQQTLAVAADENAPFEQYRRPTKRDVFLDTMEKIVPWAELCSVIEPHYPKAGNGRPPVGLERPLRGEGKLAKPSFCSPAVMRLPEPFVEMNGDCRNRLVECG